MRTSKKVLQSAKHKILLLFFLLNGLIASAQNGVETSGAFQNTIENQGTLLREASEDFERHRIWLNLLQDGNYVNQILIGYMTWATQDVDPGMDAISLSTGSYISSLIGTNGYVIQGRALPFTSDDIVPLEFKSVADGDFTINIDYVDGLFAGEQGIFLKDNQTGIVTDLKQGSYTFSTLAGTYQSRFEIIYQNAALGMEDAKFNSQVTIYKENGALAIHSGIKSISDIKIYDLNGRLLYNKEKINNSLFTVNDLATQSKIVLIQVNATDGSTMIKKIAY